MPRRKSVQKKTLHRAQQEKYPHTKKCSDENRPETIPPLRKLSVTTTFTAYLVPTFSGVPRRDDGGEKNGGEKNGGEKIGGEKDGRQKYIPAALGRERKRRRKRVAATRALKKGTECTSLAPLLSVARGRGGRATEPIVAIRGEGALRIPYFFWLATHKLGHLRNASTWCVRDRNFSGDSNLCVHRSGERLDWLRSAPLRKTL